MLTMKIRKIKLKIKKKGEGKKPQLKQHKIHLTTNSSKDPQAEPIHTQRFDKSLSNEEIQALRKARISGRSAAYNGCERPTLEALQKRLQYTVEQAQMYLEGFDATAGDENTQTLRKARLAGKNSAFRGNERPTLKILQERDQYTVEQAQAYLNSFDAAASDEETQELRKARVAGQQAANQGSKRPTLIELQIRSQYTEEQAKAYLNSFDAAAGDEETQTFRRARVSGQSAARQGIKRPTLKALQTRNQYTLKQATAYLNSFDSAAGSEEFQGLRRAHVSGRQAAVNGFQRPTHDLLQVRNLYTTKQAETYLKAFDEKQNSLALKAIKDGREITTLAQSRARDKLLADKPEGKLHQFNLEKERIAALQEKKNLKKVERAGFALGVKKVDTPCLSDEFMQKIRGYSENEIKAYKQGYEKGREERNKRHPALMMK